MNHYTYADSNDQITSNYIRDNFTEEYWNKSEVNALNHIFDYVDEDKCSMLDLGCGMGRLFSHFTNHVSSITGVEPDYSRYTEALEEAKSYNNVTVLNGTIENVLSNQYDLVFISHVLQHIPREKVHDIISSVQKVLKPNGILALTTTYTEDEDNVFGIYREDNQSTVMDLEERNLESGESNEYGFYVRNYSFQTIQKLLENAGFIIEKVFGFHYSNTDSTKQDDINNQNQLLHGAVDVLYIARKKD